MGILSDVGGLVGNIFGDGGDSEKARQILAELNAEAGPSVYASIREDPALRSSQMETLGTLRSIANGGGLRLQDKAAQQEAMDAANENERANRLGIEQSMQARGMGGGGAEIAAQLSNNQAAAQRTSRTAAQTGAQANQRALQAIAGAGQMASGIRGQDFSQNATLAQGQDAMSRFNAGQRMNKAGMQSNLIDEQGNRKRKAWSDFGAGLGGDLENLGAAAIGKWGGGGGGMDYGAYGSAGPKEW